MLLLPVVDYAALLGVSGREAVVLVAIGVIAASGNVLFNTALRAVSAQHAATIAYLEPLGAVVWALLLIGETPGWFAVAGGSLVAVGILLVIRSDRSGTARATRTTRTTPNDPNDPNDPESR